MAIPASELYCRLSKKKFVYNIMPIDNVPSVLSNGLMCFDRVRAISHNSIALNTVQARREKVLLPNGTTLHSYANLYFSYRNPMLYLRRDIAETLCILAFKPTVMDIPGCIVTDRNAATNIVRFYPPSEGLCELDFERINATYWYDDDLYKMRDNKAVKCAEVLIPDHIPPCYIDSACVLNLSAKQTLHNLGFYKNIYINPDSFFRKEEK